MAAARRRPIGAGGLGLEPAVAARRQLHLLLPGALDHPDRLQDLQRRAGGAAEVAVHADARELRRRCSSAPTASAAEAQDTGFDLLLLQLDLHRRHQRAARPGHRHARRLRLLALSAQGQRHLPVHHPDDPHDAGDRRHHPDLPDVPRDGPRRHLSRHHPALHGLQPAVHDLDDEELLRRAVARRRGRGADGRLARRSRCSSRSACRRCWPASPPPPSSA